ncbi:DUF4376 domain-containing protein [Stenotrophomonas indicatrix]|uniref:DUF4376 domain-containing protein n=1 Tax=Stenotrophomonas indicatrix TaxID=2045451 RepID=UPI00111D2E28|nr:DUF4376 domain-containing protein [Stenotrophomonas indicatrix]MDN8643458.1 DUF4376 domain-containing protein [Stenotrophomonas indicatrix]MDN8655003.1 DUF4376 domain-containing protein [Stenotrophomonas indicatrix]TPD91816.1 DUF4376 domain-containing protein [Stenotrophomonas maltophilia]
MYQLTGDSNVILNTETGAFVPRGHRLWADYQQWQDDGNTPLPLVPIKSLDQLKADLVAAATAERWERETGGILIGGVQVGTALDDQNRLSGVLSAIQVGGLESVDFKARSGWVQLTAPELQGIALAISRHVQACFTAERAHHEAIEQLQTQADVDAYDVMAGWPPGSGLGHESPPVAGLGAD